MNRERDGERYLKLNPRCWLFCVSAAVTGTLILLTWLFLRAEAVSPQEHMQYMQYLRNLREADAEADGEVLAARMDLSRNYDALTEYLRQVLDAAEQIGVTPEFLLAEDKVQQEKQVATLRDTLEQKARLIDLFKRSNSILRNSMTYFQSAANAFLASTPESELRHHLEYYVRQTQFFVRNPDPELAATLAATHQRLVALGEQSRQPRTIENLLLHGKLIETHIPEVDRQIREILYLPAKRQQEELTRFYSDAYGHARKIAQQFRIVLYIVAMLSTAYLAYTFIHLVLARRSLAKAHREVVERYHAQKRAEKQLRLHDTAFNSAHEGISLTDAKANIIDVNPAFTRITGYEREEVVGHNPRVLKSGRHDDKFYQAMWKSINETGNWRGEIWNRNKFGEAYPEMLSITAISNPKGKTTNYVAVFSDISRLKAQEKQLRQMAYYDTLTDLPNRALLSDRMSQAMAQTRRNHKIMAVCYLDLDGFKPVNDTYGHGAGDRLLMEMANRFKACLRGEDTVARLGGDEFVFLLLGLEKLGEYEQAVQRLMHNISQPVQVGAHTVTVSASIGITLYPHDSSDADTLLRHADQAMYQAKQQGKNCYHIFDPEQDSLTRSQYERISRIEGALLQHELTLYYQPKVDLRQGEVVGMEALIRWQHPEHGLVPPTEFLPKIEDHDLIVRIGKWIIDTALTQMEQWQAMGFKIPVSVNVASRQLQNLAFVDDLAIALSRHPTVDAADLELEVLETAALEDIANVSRIIDECRQLGVSFALDDFGTGYSSLTYLKRLPASTLKIDQSFVRDMLDEPENLAIVHGILGLATAFQRHAVAEGVESVEHGRMLIQLGCRYAQGYGIAKPMPALEVLSWIQQWQPSPVWQSIAGLHWDDYDYPLLAAEVEHQRWVSLLLHAVTNDLPVSHKDVDNYHHCRFGQWYYGRGKQRYGEMSHFQQVELSHRRVHEIAGEIEQYHRAGKPDQAKALFPELLAQRDDILMKLKQLERSVALSHVPSV